MAKKEKREKLPQGISPAGVFKFPKLNEPDTKFKEEGEYVVNLLVEPDAPGVQELIDQCDEWAAASLAKAKEEAGSAAKAKKWTTKYLPYKQDEDEDGEETGLISIKFGSKASGIAKKTGKPWERSPDIFDAKGKKMKKVPSIWGGTVGKVGFTAVPYSPTPQVGASVSLRLDGVQIIDLVSGGNRSAGDYGFAEEEGYSYEDDDDTSGDDTASDDDDGEGAEDF